MTTFYAAAAITELRWSIPRRRLIRRATSCVAPIATLCSAPATFFKVGPVKKNSPVDSETDINKPGELKFLLKGAFSKHCQMVRSEDLLEVCCECW